VTAGQRGAVVGVDRAVRQISDVVVDPGPVGADHLDLLRSERAGASGIGQVLELVGTDAHLAHAGPVPFGPLGEAVTTGSVGLAAQLTKLGALILRHVDQERRVIFAANVLVGSSGVREVAEVQRR
jgi:hypothetical protein